jgi:Tol biopolymer transport system component/DNA-binding winged helix-turn-helix (wHTH) protein
VSKSSTKKIQKLSKAYPNQYPASTEEMVSGVYQFGPFSLDPSERMLYKNGVPVKLTPKSFDILLLLVQNSGRLLTKNQLMDAIWPDAFVEEKTLSQNIFTLRRALGLDETGQQYINTIPKHGYRFSGEVKVYQQPVADELPESLGETETFIDRQTDRVNRPDVETENGLYDYEKSPARSATDSSKAHFLKRALKLSRVPIKAVAAVVILFGALALIVSRPLLGRFIRTDSYKQNLVSSKNLSFIRLTGSGNVKAMGLSPDGQYIAYAETVDDKQRLLIRHVNAPAVVEIIPPSEMNCIGITFSQDGAWLFFVAYARGGTSGVLYRVAALGGAPQKISSGVDSSITLSPDGRRLAFIRRSDASRKTVLMTANVDGAEERQLAERNMDDGFESAGPAWSPDGEVIVSATRAYTGSRRYADIVAVDASSGAMRPLLLRQWNWIGQVAWLSDGSGIVLTGWDADSEVMSASIWVLDYPGGQAHHITKDAVGYVGVGVSRSGDEIAAEQVNALTDFWVLPKGDLKQAQRIASKTGELFSNRLGACWAPDGRIIYSTWQSGNPDIWVMSADGLRQKQLTFDAGLDYQPAVSPDGRYIVYISQRGGGRHLRRMDMDGGNDIQLTSSAADSPPSISPDSKWAVYVAYIQDRPTIWRVPLEGGSPQPLTETTSLLPAFSPDGDSIACLLADHTSGNFELALLSSNDGRVLKQFNAQVLPNTPAIRWLPDGSAITYVSIQKGVSNIWGQPVGGSEPNQMTDWGANLVYRFDWSKEGDLLCERGPTLTDIVLIRLGD